MADLCVTIMTKNKYLLLPFLILILNSCETLQDMAGLTKPDLENDLMEQTPELVLPPDFDRVARKSDRDQSQRVLNNTQPINNFTTNSYQSVQPSVTNYIAPQINIESSPTPSDSLERFKENKKFTIGQWVYGQYVQGFKQGNLYYRPVYDKGYNFSRRYIPDQNVSSFIGNPQYTPKNFSNIINQENQGIQNLDNLPIID